MTDDPVPHSGPGNTPTVALQTVGCKLNQAESEALARQFVQAGFKLVSPESKPDVFVLNTCTVTHIADRKCRQYLRAFRREHPGALVVAAGCYVDRDVDSARVAGVNLAVSNAEKHCLVQTVTAHLETRKAVTGTGEPPYASALSRTRSMIKIQEGCSHGCTYCIVPKVRGPERSIPAGEIVSQIRAREREGYQEVVLTGTRIGKWDGGLNRLLARVLSGTNIPRIRLSSLQPREISAALLRLWAEDERICRHLHMALQNGSSTVLKRMGRDYTLDEYAETLDRVRQAMPDMAITTDIIVGFPGESDAEFAENCDFCRRMAFAGIHVFPYSRRENTPSPRMGGDVSADIRKGRSQRVFALATTSAAAFRDRFYGAVLPVLWEERKTDGIWVGHTGNYLKVFAAGSANLHNHLTDTRLGRAYRDGVWGDVCPISVPAAKGV